MALRWIGNLTYDTGASQTSLLLIGYPPKARWQKKSEEDPGIRLAVDAAKSHGVLREERVTTFFPKPTTTSPKRVTLEIRAPFIPLTCVSESRLEATLRSQPMPNLRTRKASWFQVVVDLQAPQLDSEATGLLTAFFNVGDVATVLVEHNARLIGLSKWAKLLRF